MSALWKKMKPYCKAVLNLIIFILLFLLCLYALPKVLVFFMPFVIGGIIALIASPFVRFFEKKLKIKRKTGTAVVIVAVIALVILLGYFAGSVIVEESIAFFRELPDMWVNLQKEFAVIGERLAVFYSYFPADVKNALLALQENLASLLGEQASNISTPTIEALSRFAKNIPSIIIGVIMCLLSAYFFVSEREYLRKVIPGIIPGTVLSRWDMMKNSLKHAVGGYFKAQLKIEIWVYILLVIGFTILGVEYALLIAIGIALLDFLPFFGTGAVLMPWAVIKFLSADYKMFIGILIIWGVSQLVRQVIQPKIMGDSIGMPPVPTLFLLFIGYKAGGVIGMIVGVPIGIIVKNLYDEGAFETTRNSMKILIAGINNFRRLDQEDMEVVDDSKSDDEQKNKQ